MAGGLNTFLQEMIKRKMIRKIPEGLTNKFMTYRKHPDSDARYKYTPQKYSGCLLIKS